MDQMSRTNEESRVGKEWPGVKPDLDEACRDSPLTGPVVEEFRENNRGPKDFAHFENSSSEKDRVVERPKSV